MPTVAVLPVYCCCGVQSTSGVDAQRWQDCALVSGVCCFHWAAREKIGILAEVLFS